MRSAAQLNHGDGDPQPGDLIEIYRVGYRHWMVYVGDGFVVHVTNPDGGSGGSGSGRNNEKAVIKKEKLQDAVKGSKWKINNLLDQIYPPRRAVDIVELALSLVDAEPGYHLLENNCEHFATMLRYGHSESQQVRVAFEKLEKGWRNTLLVSLALGLWLWLCSFWRSVHR